MNPMYLNLILSLPEVAVLGHVKEAAQLSTYVVPAQASVNVEQAPVRSTWFAFANTLLSQVQKVEVCSAATTTLKATLAPAFAGLICLK